MSATTKRGAEGTGRGHAHEMSLSPGLPFTPSVSTFTSERTRCWARGDTGSARTEAVAEVVAAKAVEVGREAVDGGGSDDAPAEKERRWPAHV